MTRDCSLLKRLKDRGMELKMNGKMNSIEVDENDGDDEINKLNNYFCFDCVNTEEYKTLGTKMQHNVNPFMVPIKINEKCSQALLDTGADVSILHYDLIPDKKIGRAHV